MSSAGENVLSLVSLVSPYATFLQTKKKRGSGRHLSIEVAHDLQGHVAAFVHGDDLLVADRVETPAGRTRQQRLYSVSESASKVVSKWIRTCRQFPAGCNERRLSSLAVPYKRGANHKNCLCLL